MTTMLYRISLLLLFVFNNCQLFSQGSLQTLPYNEIPKIKIKKATAGIILAKMIDSLGYRYYLATDNFDASNSFTDKASVLINGVYKASNIMRKSLQDSVSSVATEAMNFKASRSRTLYNLKKASGILVSDINSLTKVNWYGFIRLMEVTKAYCNELIVYRKSQGEKVLTPEELFKKIPESKQFEQTLGAFGVTHQEWMDIMRYGGGQDGFDRMRQQSKVNTSIIRALKEKESVTATVKVGELQDIEMYTSTVEGMIYNYFNDKPRQLSFLYESDKAFIKGLIEWTIYINAGKPAILSDIFRLGITSDSLSAPYEGLLINTNNTSRTIVDNQYDSINISVSKRYLKDFSFINIPINQVHITKDNTIAFLRINDSKDYFGKKEFPVIIFKNIDGSLLKSIKNVIKKSKDGGAIKDLESLNLKTY